MTPEFGDDATSVHKAYGKFFVRLIVCIPLGTIGVALTVTVIGAPLGIPILVLCGKWMVKDLQAHPIYNIKAASSSDEVDDLEDDWRL